MKGGIDVRANLNYALTLKLTGSYKLRNGPANLCVTLSHSWPDNSIDVYPYYQYRMVQFIDVGGFRIVSYCRENDCMLFLHLYHYCTQLVSHPVYVNYSMHPNASQMVCFFFFVFFFLSQHINNSYRYTPAICRHHATPSVRTRTRISVTIIIHSVLYIGKR